jgi:dinuclear metal center YbgI/SA1388 family protein
MIAAEIIKILEKVAPPSLQEPYDNSGLLTGQHQMEVSGVMVSLDMTEEVIDEAIERGCQMVISHHPIIFRGLKRINGYTYVERVVIKAIRHGIGLYAIHTNLDNVLYQGVNEQIGKKLGLSDMHIMIPKNESNAWQGMDVGTGIVGFLEKPMPVIDFLHLLKSVMITNCIRFAGPDEKQVHKVAICGGSGSSFLPAAISSNADAYVSADFKYHEFFDAEDKILIADIGHFESEQFTIELLYTILRNNFPNFAVHKTSVLTNPIKYHT